MAAIVYGTSMKFQFTPEWNNIKSNKQLKQWLIYIHNVPQKGVGPCYLNQIPAPLALELRHVTGLGCIP